MKLRVNESGNIGSIKSTMKREESRVRKASITAAKIEGYRLARELKGEMRASVPGGKKLHPLSVIRSGRLSGGRKPLSRMAITPRYATVTQGNTSKTMIGFLKIKLSKRWIQLADKHQDGFQVGADSPTPIGSTYRKMFARIGASIKNKKIAKYYFLRKSTKVLKTPARMIIVPFWKSHQTEAARNIKWNFERKMLGQRI